MSDPSGRKTPPESPDDWDYIWSGVKFSHDARPLIGPVIAVVRNWKAAVAVLAFVAWMNSPEISDALAPVLEALK